MSDYEGWDIIEALAYVIGFPLIWLIIFLIPVFSPATGDDSNIQCSEVIKINENKDLLVTNKSDYYLIRNVKDRDLLVNSEDKVKFRYDGEDLKGTYTIEIKQKGVNKGKKVKAKPVKEIELTAVMWVKI